MCFSGFTSDSSPPSTQTTTGIEKSPTRVLSPTPNKKRSKSPRKGSMKKPSPTLLQVKLTPPRKTTGAASISTKSVRNEAHETCPSQKKSVVVRADVHKSEISHCSTGAHGTSDSDATPPKKMFLKRATEAAKAQAKAACNPSPSTSMTDSGDSSPNMEKVSVKETKKIKSSIALEVPRRVSPRSKNSSTSKLTLSSHSKHVTWDLGHSKSRPIEISQSSEDGTPVRQQKTVRRTNLNDKFGTAGQSTSDSSPTYIRRSPRGKKSTYLKLKKEPKEKKPSEIRDKSPQKSLSPKNKQPNLIQTKIKLPKKHSCNHKSSPKGATSDIEADEALIRSTDLSHANDKSIKEHLSDLNITSPETGDSTDSSGDYESRSSGGYKWTSQKIEALCSMWEEEEHLYNPCHPQYRHKKLRAKAHKRMSAALNMSGKIHM